jgi:hypothetical protein
MQLKDTILYLKLTNTSCLIRSLALSLPRRQITIYINNYFTSVPLFKELRTCEFGAIGTTCPYAEFPAGMKELKDWFSKSLNGTLVLLKSFKKRYV